MRELNLSRQPQRAASWALLFLGCCLWQPALRSHTCQQDQKTCWSEECWVYICFQDSQYYKSKLLYLLLSKIPCCSTRIEDGIEIPERDLALAHDSGCGRRANANAENLQKSSWKIANLSTFWTLPIFAWGTSTTICCGKPLKCGQPVSRKTNQVALVLDHQDCMQVSFWPNFCSPDIWSTARCEIALEINTGTVEKSRKITTHDNQQRPKRTNKDQTHNDQERPTTTNKDQKQPTRSIKDQ